MVDDQRAKASMTIWRALEDFQMEGTNVGVYPLDCGVKWHRMWMSILKRATSLS